MATRKHTLSHLSDSARELESSLRDHVLVGYGEGNVWGPSFLEHCSAVAGATV